MARLLRLAAAAITLACAASSSACAGTFVKVEPPPPLGTLAFRPAPGHENEWLATSIALEVVHERDARILEAEDPIYLGEISVLNGKTPSFAALVAAGHGATHYREVVVSDDRVDLVLYRVEPARWHWLPEHLRPVPPA